MDPARCRCRCAALDAGCTIRGIEVARLNLTSFSQYQPRDGGRFVAATIDDAVLQAVTDWANLVFQTSQELVAVDTGELKASGRVEVAITGKTFTAAIVYDSDHSVYVEFGTGIRGAASAGAGDGPYDPNWPGMPAQPYLRPAFDQHREEAPSMVKATIAVALR